METQNVKRQLTSRYHPNLTSTCSVCSVVATMDQVLAPELMTLLD